MLTPNINLENKTVFITGAAGFIGANLAKELLKTINQINIIGIDIMNSYYDVEIKKQRLAQIDTLVKEKPDSTFTFIQGNIADKLLIDKIFTENKIDIVVNLAAQAGVRYSI